MLEKKINIGASYYKFADKKRFYEGYTTNQGVKKEGTKVVELLTMASERTDFAEQDIHSRHKEIVEGFIDYLRNSGLLQ